MPTQLFVGLGNPGPNYEHTRHNAGAWVIEALARAHHITLRPETKFHGLYAKCSDLMAHLLIPTTFMNHSGLAVKAISQFYKIPPENICIIHDDLDLAAGIARIKQGGGHGGHNGLRDIIRHLGTQDFTRLRIGIDHPGERQQVLDYVLGRPSKAQEQAIYQAIDISRPCLPLLCQGDYQQAMNQLHTEIK